MKFILLFSLFLSSLFAEVNYNKYDYLFKKYEEESGVPSFLLKAVAVNENDTLNPYAIRENTNNTRDLGLMQINTIWAREFNIRESDLLKPEVNIKVASIILADLINKYGYSWETVGRYHSATPSLKRIWLARIKKNIIMLAKMDRRLTLARN